MEEIDELLKGLVWETNHARNYAKKSVSKIKIDKPIMITDNVDRE